ncbi:aryl-sulfate sulfotransferase [Thermodesulfobacteriota bacterium]
MKGRTADSPVFNRIEAQGSSKTMVPTLREKRGSYDGRTRALHGIRDLFLIATAAAILACGCTFDPQVTVTQWNPALTYDGYTLYSVNALFSPMTSYLAAVDMSGAIAWEFRNSDLGILYEYEPLPNGNVLCIATGSLYEITPDGGIAWEHHAVTAHHDVDLLSDGSIIYLYNDVLESEFDDFQVLTDGIQILDMETHEVLWDWKLYDYMASGGTADGRDLRNGDLFDMTQPHRVCPYCWSNEITDSILRDWTHTNTVYFDEVESSILINIRNLNRMIKISYPSGELLWTLGDGGDFGERLFSHAHDPMVLADGNILLFDNGLHRPESRAEYSRAIELVVDPDAGHAEIVWEYRESPDFFSSAFGDADRLPNGNTLIADAVNGRLLEITPGLEIAWEMRLPDSYMIYKAERISLPPMLRF